MSVKTFNVETRGVGRVDYSQEVHYATEPFIRSNQLRAFYSVRYTGLAPLVLPDAYEAPLAFLVDNVLQNVAPLRPWMLYLISAVADRNALVAITLLRYNSYRDYLNGNIAEYLGTAYGYGKAELNLRKGILTQSGSVYTVLFGEYSGLNFNLAVTIHGLIGGLEQIE
jgi:hypothetical protein